MSDEIGDSYDLWAEQYTAHNRNALERVPSDLERVTTFAELAAAGEGIVADFGCGPGHVSNHLAGHGLDVVGYDCSAVLIAEARRAFPGLDFRVADFTALHLPDRSFGAIIARHSLIHMKPELLDGVFCDLFRLLRPGAPLLVSFFAAASADDHGTPFDHVVATAYALFPATIADLLEQAGFASTEITVRLPLPGERPLDHGTVVTRKPSG